MRTVFGKCTKTTRFLQNFYQFLAHFCHFFAHSFPQGVIIVPKMPERSAINFNSTRTSDSGKTCSQTVTNCYPECTKTHHFDIKIQKFFWGGGCASAPRPAPPLAPNPGDATGNNYIRTNESSSKLSARTMFARDSSFWRYKVYADIRQGSRARRRQLTVGWSKAVNIQCR